MGKRGDRRRHAGGERPRQVLGVGASTANFWLTLLELRGYVQFMAISKLGGCSLLRMIFLAILALTFRSIRVPLIQLTKSQTVIVEYESLILF